MSQEGVSVFSETVCHLGEGPTYDPATDTVYWFDIAESKLLERKSAGGETTVHDLGMMGSALAVIDADRQLILTETGLHVRDVKSGRLTMHTPVEADNPLTRSNDARVHPCGAFWVGTMGKTSEDHAGAIYWFFKGELRLIFPKISIPNSICFTADGGTAYFTDTRIGLLMRVGCDPATGLPAGEPSVFVDHRARKGSIDGSIVDAEGTLWNACWGASCVNAYSPDGRLVRTIPVPALQASCPAFVGPNADRIVVTSAWQDMDPAARKADPGAGKTYILDIPVRGRFEPKVLI